MPVDSRPVAVVEFGAVISAGKRCLITFWRFFRGLRRSCPQCGYADPEHAKERHMRALLIAVVVGAVLAAGAGLGAGALLSGVANGKPANSQLYNYGQR